jgi:hypothetical protein
MWVEQVLLHEQVAEAQLLGTLGEAAHGRRINVRTQLRKSETDPHPIAHG